MKRIRFIHPTIYILLCVHVFATAVSLRAQSIAAYHRYFKNVEQYWNIVDKWIVIQEVKRYLQYYFLSDSCGWVLHIGARAALDLLQQPKILKRPNPCLPAIWLCKARYVYKIPLSEQIKRDFQKALHQKAGFLNLRSAFSREQIAKLSQLFLDTFQDGSVAERARSFIHEVFLIRDKNIAKVLIDEIEWFLGSFPVANYNMLMSLYEKTWNLIDANLGKGFQIARKILAEKGGYDSLSKEDVADSVSKAKFEQENRKRTSDHRTNKGLKGIKRTSFPVEPERPLGIDTNLRLGLNKTDIGYIILKKSGEIFFDTRLSNRLTKSVNIRKKLLRLLAEKAQYTLAGEICREIILNGYEDRSDEEIAIFAINYFRKKVGLPAIHSEESLVRAAEAHAKYCAEQKLISHIEEKNKKGFVGEYPWDRIEKFGGCLGLGKGELIGSYGIPWLDVISWIFTVYHRDGLLDPTIIKGGYGSVLTPRYRIGVFDYCFDVEDSLSDTLNPFVSFPYDGQKNVPPGWEGLENPDPFPSINVPIGFPITIYPIRLGVIIHEVLLFDEQGNRVQLMEPKVISQEENVFCRVPRYLLKNGTEYKVKVFFTANGKKSSKIFGFTTVEYPIK